MRGRRNEPAYVVHTARVVAAAAGVSEADLAAATVANTCAVFRIPPAPTDGSRGGRSEA
jgi:TatD DNase family protein